MRKARIVATVLAGITAACVVYILAMAWAFGSLEDPEGKYEW